MDFLLQNRQVIVTSSRTRLCGSPVDILKTAIFKEVLRRFLEFLVKKDSPLLEIFPESPMQHLDLLSEFLIELVNRPKDEILEQYPKFRVFLKDPFVLPQLIEMLYSFWRSFERFLVVCSDSRQSADKSLKPYRTFNESIETINHYVRSAYRDIVENLTGTHPQVYRQIAAGFQIAMIAIHHHTLFPQRGYQKLNNVQFIKQILMEPPIIIDPPMNTRSGSFQQIMENPLHKITINPDDFLCFPAQVGHLIIYIYFNKEFIGLGSALANLFELVQEQELMKAPDAICVFGAKRSELKDYGDFPTVYFDDIENNLLVGVVPDGDEFGYFGYLKKMALTLHNVLCIKKGRLPVHGAMVNIKLKGNITANVLLVGDSGAGKSESIEAFRSLSATYLRQMTVIFDDMGSLVIEDGDIKAYGTETGAFVRLDDLQPEFAFGNIDRSIIMSPQKINARVVIPITTLEEIQKGYHVDYIFYANNYDQVDSSQTFLEIFDDAQEAIKVFRDGARMAKGTTSEVGITHSYFANPFGAPQHKEQHEKIAKKFFDLFFERKIAVGQLRTRLGIPGFEKKGPESAAKAMFDYIIGTKS